MLLCHYIFFFFELIIDKSLYDTSLASATITQQNNLISFFAQSRTCNRSAHLPFRMFIIKLANLKANNNQYRIICILYMKNHRFLPKTNKNIQSNQIQDESSSSK